MKKYLFIMVLCSIIQISFAQSKEGQSSEPARKATFINNGFWDHWFIGAGAGANIYLATEIVMPTSSIGLPWHRKFSSVNGSILIWEHVSREQV